MPHGDDTLSTRELTAFMLLLVDFYVGRDLPAAPPNETERRTLIDLARIMVSASDENGTARRQAGGGSEVPGPGVA